MKQVLRDLREHDCDMLTLGQYLQPSRYHLKVERFVEPAEFADLGDYARQLGFTSVASAPMVRSSYHADLQASRGLRFVIPAQAGIQSYNSGTLRVKILRISYSDPMISKEQSTLCHSELTALTVERHASLCRILC